MRSLSVWIVISLLMLGGGGLWWLSATPPGTQETGATISWSVPTLTGTMFPGTSSTTVVTFRSEQNLSGVVVEATPSLNGIVSVSPSSFASVVANQVYQLTFTLKAPPEFIKRAFGGTVHIRNNDKPPKTYAKPLVVELRTDWQSTSTAGVIVSYPSGWISQPLLGGLTGAILTNNPNPGPLSDASLMATPFFQIMRFGSTPGHVNNLPANPNMLPITQWYAAYFTSGFSVPPSSQTVVSVAGRQAVKIELVEVGGLRVHIYVPRGQDVFEISYGLFAPDFVPVYEQMLSSLQL